MKSIHKKKQKTLTKVNNYLKFCIIVSAYKYILYGKTKTAKYNLQEQLRKLQNGFTYNVSYTSLKVNLSYRFKEITERR